MSVPANNTPADGRVILLTSPGFAKYLLANELACRVNLVGIVVQRRPASTRGRASSLKRLLKSILGEALYQRALGFKHSLSAPPLERKIQRIEGQLKRRAHAELLAGLPADLSRQAPNGWPDGVEVFETPKINHQETVDWCRERRPDVTAVYGTAILRAPIIRVATRGTVNAHSSLLPHFRGVFAEFWQILHRRPDTAGVTFHFIDEGVDTGDILLQKPTVCEADTDPYQLRGRNILTTVEFFPEVLRQVLTGEARRQKQSPSDLPTFRSRDLTREKTAELLRQLGYEL